MQAKIPALSAIFHEAGFSWSSADEMVRRFDVDALEGCSSDDLAGALFKWRAAQVNRRLAAARHKVIEMSSKDSGEIDLADTYDAIKSFEEREDQMEMFDRAEPQEDLNH